MLKSKKDETAVVAVGSALSNADIVLQLQNIKNEFRRRSGEFVAMCVQSTVQFFSGGKSEFNQSEVLRFFFYMTKYKDVILVEKKNQTENRGPSKP